MGLSAEAIELGLRAIAETTPGIADALSRVGFPEPRIRARGHATMLRTIVGQQVSVAAASSMWAKLVGVVGEEADPSALLSADFDTLRACGLSRQKQSYARSLCELVLAGELDFCCPPMTRQRSTNSPASKASGGGRRKSIFSLPKGAPTSGPQATLRCRSGWANC
jgi:DNA-3-methyladenine glycosylase II